MSERIIALFENFPPELATFLISMIPVVEVRGALPFAITQGVPIPLAMLLAILGNIFPVIFIVLGLEKVSDFLIKRSKLAERFFNWLFERTRKKLSASYQKWGCMALMLFVAIPLPVTGAWTGSVGAYLFEIPAKKAFAYITAGVVIASVIVLILTKGIQFIL